MKTRKSVKNQKKTPKIKKSEKKKKNIKFAEAQFNFLYFFEYQLTTTKFKETFVQAYQNVLHPRKMTASLLLHLLTRQSLCRSH